MRLTGRLPAAALMLLVALPACQEQVAPEVPVAAVPEPSETAPEQALPSKPLRLGRPPHISVAGAKQEYTPLAIYLGKAIGHEIEVVVPTSYDKVVDLFAKGELDLALMTPFLYVNAKERVPDLRLLATMLGEGSKRYRGYIVTKSSARTVDLQALRGKRFAFVDRASTSGFLFPRVLLLDAGIDPERDFSEVRFAGDHPKVVHWVLNGVVDAGAISSTTFEHLRGESIQNRLNIVAKTDWIPLDAFVAHPSLPMNTVKRLTETLLGLSYRDPETRDLLTGVTTTSGFVAGDDASYEPVRRVVARLAGETTKKP